MLKKIEPSQLRVGMFFERAEGSWLNHQLWRRSFLIDDAAELAKVMRAGLSRCWIDTRRGLDVALPIEPACGLPGAVAYSHCRLRVPNR